FDRRYSSVHGKGWSHDLVTLELGHRELRRVGIERIAAGWAVGEQRDDLAVVVEVIGLEALFTTGQVLDAERPHQPQRTARPDRHKGPRPRIRAGRRRSDHGRDDLSRGASSSFGTHAAS